MSSAGFRATTNTLTNAQRSCYQIATMSPACAHSRRPPTWIRPIWTAPHVLPFLGAAVTTTGPGGSRDGSTKKWKHVGSGPYWADLCRWSATVGTRWTHCRNLIEGPLSVGECVCCRPDCVSGMYQQCKARARKDELGSWDVMEIGQSSPTSCYPSTISQVQALVANVEMNGVALDCCGARGDAVSTVLAAHSMLCVSTNDFDRRMTADTHIDASTDAFRLAFSEGTGHPDWIVTSPPYNNAFCILKQAWEVVRVGVALKLSF